MDNNPIVIVEDVPSELAEVLKETGNIEVKNVALTQEHIAAIQAGKALVISIGSMGTPEYSVVIRWKVNDG